MADHQITDARPAVCQVCGRGAVLEIMADGAWAERCQHCGEVQSGLPGFPPPEYGLPTGLPVALGLPL